MGIEFLTFVNPAAPAPTNPLFAIFFYVLLTPIAVALQFLDHAFVGFGPTNAIGAFGLAVIVLTMVIRGLLFPLFRWQIRTQWKIQADQRRMGPELREIQAKYKKDKPRLQAETMALYKRHQINPLSQLSGCFPLLIQLPFIYSLFGSINKLSKDLHGHTNFLWIQNLDQSALKAGLLSHPTMVIVPILAGLLTFMQSKMMMQQQRPDMTDQEKQMYNVMRQTTYLMPVLIAVFALNFSQGIGLYWITQSGIMVVQVFSMMGWGGLKVPPWFPGATWRPKNSPLGRMQAPTPAVTSPAIGGNGSLVTGTPRRPAPRPSARRTRSKERGRPRR
ncbi:MAG TPA: YidC/Oxa1 family membrane protein insertase [Candidatus Dormibacteraeota bacterium]|nr:YidC/Oxa1 family membrane protein insertase [Candidatus Dormibacteraeota bacterium]